MTGKHSYVLTMYENDQRKITLEVPAIAITDTASRKHTIEGMIHAACRELGIPAIRGTKVIGADEDNT